MLWARRLAYVRFCETLEVQSRVQRTRPGARCNLTVPPREFGQKFSRERLSRSLRHSRLHLVVVCSSNRQTTFPQKRDQLKASPPVEVQIS